MLFIALFLILCICKINVYISLNLPQKNAFLKCPSSNIHSDFTIFKRVIAKNN